MSSITEMLDNINDTPFEGNQNFELQLEEEVKKSMPYAEPLLNERETTHGDYINTARIAQRLKDIIKIEQVRRKQRGQPRTTDTQQECLDMICTKIARIIAGESGFQDHWDDIAGYAKIARPDV